MAKTHYVAGVDVGSTTARVVIAQQNPEEEQPTVLGIGESPMGGMQKGVVTDVEEASASVTAALDAAERIAGVPVEHAYVSVNGSHIASQNSRGVIAVGKADGEITPEDVDRVINAAQAISLPANREILHVLPQDFVVDGQEHIQDPVGMTGVRLEVDAHIINGSAPFIKNLTKVVNQSGVHIEDFVFAPLAAASVVLDKRQKELGVVLVDLGGATTSIAVFEEHRLLHTAVLPVGSSHITNDIAIGLRTSIDTAEAIKLEHGTALPEEVKENETIIAHEEDESEEHFSRKEVAKIIDARLDELFSFVNSELKHIGRAGLLPAGVVLTGGGAHLPGIIPVAKKQLKLPVRLSKPKGITSVIDRIDDPSMTVAIGLIVWGVDQESRGHTRQRFAVPDIGNTVNKVKDWMRTFLP